MSTPRFDRDATDVVLRWAVSNLPALERDAVRAFG